MSDAMRPVPFRELIERIFGEYGASKSIFGIPAEHFFKKKGSKNIRFARELCATPIGPAAGPHTQLAQNLITAYLTGGRFFELKTVQKLDQLELGKPCIDAEDEAYNTEWSTELTVKKAYNEYVKAWFVLHLLEELFSLSGGSGRDGSPPFAFNMSVGYDLAGIQLPKMDAFINDLMNGEKSKFFNQCREELKEIISEGTVFDRAGVTGGPELSSLSGRIPNRVCSSLTISTLHGCPPEEIQAIAEYIIREKQLDTLVKLNPTLLGYDRARTLLDSIGFSRIKVKEATFSHDLQYGDALPMIKSLRQTAEKNGVTFGVKLSNTLPSVNEKGLLPDEEMYMSGRSLYPLTINLAADLAEDFGGALPISFCGGLTSLNLSPVFQAGVRPLTMATDLMKPGGYLRMKAAAEVLEELDSWDSDRVNPEALADLADRATGENYVQQWWRGNDKARVEKPLPLFDCYTAPCMEACPICQDVPEYIQLVGEGKYGEALGCIYDKNPLPSITGTICDHQCMYHCTRLDYEGAVKIRDMKLQAAVKGSGAVSPGDAGISEAGAASGAQAADVRAAVIGAGPAGLAAAFFLRRYGFGVTVFEKEASPGGVVRNVLPAFRLSEEAISRDTAFIESAGVDFRFGVDPEMTLQGIRKEGYEIICLAVGAEKGNILDLPGGGTVVESLSFLREIRAGKSPSPGKRVVVVGGGNTAMDSARAAVRQEGVEAVTVVYRRTDAEMPADREEYENAIADGVVFEFLLQTEEFSENGNLRCRVMELGEADDSGRRRPVPTDEIRELTADTVVSAVGEHVDSEFLTRFGIKVDKKGRPAADPGVYIIGDARTGPSTVVECIAEARKAADAIAASYGGSMSGGAASRVNRYGSALELRDALAGRKKLRPSINGGPITETGSSLEASEKERCLECDLICNKCVEVCPNRANAAVEVPADGDFENLFQIVHIDAYCNECGNCATFCPWEGKPYLDKITIFNLEEDFENSENPGFILLNGKGKFRIAGGAGNKEIRGGINTMEDGSVKLDPEESAGPAERSGLKRLGRLIPVLLKHHSYLFGKVEH